MSASLRLISLNIERHKHLDLVEAFLAARKPDVACIQEVFEHDLDRLSRALEGASYSFEPMGRRPDEPPPGIFGVAIFSRLPITGKQAQYYVGKPGALRDSSQSDISTFNFLNRMVLVCDVEQGGSTFRIATTHFTWTPDGKADDAQRMDMRNLLRVLEDMGEFVLAGDFNAPRGGEIFGMLAPHYKDNVPAHLTSSLDPQLHHAGHLQRMVDGIFSTPNYMISNFETVSGVSDHCALAVTVSKTS